MARPAASTGADLALIAVFAALIAVFSLTPIPAGVIGVPITLQTLAVALTGLVLGAWRGLLATLLYVVVGLAGLPVLAGGSAGIGVLAGFTAGYLLSFPLAAAVTTIHLVEGADGILKPVITPVEELPLTNEKRYGLFPSNKKAKDTIQSICNEHSLCYHVCGLEKSNGRACSAYQLKRCRGYCVGKQVALQHNVKLIEALGVLALQTWPYNGPITITERDTSGQEIHLIVNNWMVLGTAESHEETVGLLKQSVEPQIDKDTYRYLVATIFSKKSSALIKPISEVIQICFRP